MKGLCISINRNKLHPMQSCIFHSIYCRPTCTTNTNNFYIRKSLNVARFYFRHKYYSSFPIIVTMFVSVMYPVYTARLQVSNTLSYDRNLPKIPLIGEVIWLREKPEPPSPEC